MRSVYLVALALVELSTPASATGLKVEVPFMLSPLPTLSAPPFLSPAEQKALQPKPLDLRGVRLGLPTGYSIVGLGLRKEVPIGQMRGIGSIQLDHGFHIRLKLTN
jgi:hypothetical protein